MPDVRPGQESKRMAAASEKDAWAAFAWGGRDRDRRIWDPGRRRRPPRVAAGWSKGPLKQSRRHAGRRKTNTRGMRVCNAPLWLGGPSVGLLLRAYLSI